MKKVFWIVNFTGISGTGRTTGCKIFDLRRDAVEFSNDKFGYIIRAEDDSREFEKYFGGFEPSATEGASMNHLLGYFSEPKRVDKLSIAYQKGRSCNKSNLWLMNRMGV